MRALVLSGGGAKGSYQIGVWKALREYKIDKYINYISATSIGSLNSLLFVDGDLNKAINIWENISKEVALTKKSFKDIIVKKSLYSREGFIDLADKYINFDKVSNSRTKIWVVATPVSKNVKGAPTNFCLSGKSKEEIMNIVLASSAIPVVFEPVYINGIKYRDGYMIDNNPVIQEAKALKEQIQQERGQSQLQKELEKVSELNPEVKTIEDFAKLSNFEEMDNLIRNRGFSLSEAYIQANYKELVGKQTAIAKQQAINAVKGKSHLTSTEGTAGEEIVVPKDTIEMYKALNPEMSLSEIKEDYAKRQKAKGRK